MANRTRAGGRIGEYERLRNLDWEPKSVKLEDTLIEPTKYDLPKHGYDPFRLTSLEYHAMEAQKDEDLYGMLEGAVRHGAAQKIEQRFGEYVKLIAAMLPPAEHYAHRSFGRAVRAIPVPELQAGYSYQMLDEMRHFQMEMMCWNRFRMKHNYPDPYGFDRWPGMWSRTLAGNLFRSGVENFITNDPISNLVFIQMFAETASTNMLFVAMPDIAARNGDDVYATCGLSIQSDEARHMANGYATLMSVIEASDRNVELLQEDVIWGAWRDFTTFALPIMFVYEASAKVRPERSALELWEQWVLDQFYGSYMGKLEKYGIKVPDEMIEDMHEWVRWGPSTLGAFAQIAWPFMFWRQEPLGPADFEWYEKKYPGWYDRYGIIYQLIDECSHKENGAWVTQEGLSLLGKGLQLCQVCHYPTLLPHPMIDVEKYRRFVKKPGHNGGGERIMAFCSKWCEGIYDREPQRFQTAGFYDSYKDWQVGDILRDQNLVRPDGKLIPQPRLDTLGTDDMWSVEDIDRFGVPFSLSLTEADLDDPMIPHAAQTSG